MTEYSSKTLRAAMKAKAARLASGSDATKIGASDFTPAEALNADIQTGARPLTRRRFKSGGKVVGAANAQRADKKKRGNSPISSDSFINRNVLEANEEREGKKHIGAFKKGGRAKHATDGKVPMPPKMPADIRASRAMEAAKSSVPERDPSIPTAAEEARMRAASAASTAANAADARRQAEKDRFDAIGQKRGGKAEAKCWGGRSKKAGGGMLEDSKKAMLIAADPHFKNAKVSVTPQPKPVQAPDDQKKAAGGRAKKNNGGPNVKKIPMGVSGLSQDDQTKWEKYKENYTPRPFEKEVAPVRLPDTTEELTGELKMKKGGRAKKNMGGPMMDPRAQMVSKNRMNFGSGPSGSPYKKGGKVAFEGSAKDEAQDTKLAKKYGMSMMAWEKSKQDKKHDEQESTAGLKKGGRAERKSGGRTKGKTNIKIVIATGKGQQDSMMPDNGGMPPKMPSPAMPIPSAPPSGMPPMAGAGAPPMPMPAGAPPMPAGMDKMMPRKAGGRVYKSYKDMDAGSGSGLGRLEKTEIAKRTAHKHGGKTYKSYKDMDAGAASGMGRLEKTEIAARGR
jgi:hypothetical protein